MKKVLLTIAGCLLLLGANAQTFNEWFCSSMLSTTLQTNSDNEAVIVVPDAGDPWSVQFCNVYNGMTGQSWGNNFKITFDVKWESESAASSTTGYFLTGHNYLGTSQLHDEWQWSSENTEVIFEDAEWACGNIPFTAYKGSWTKVSIEGEIGENGASYIGIQINLGDLDGYTVGTFYFKNIEVKFGSNTVKYFTQPTENINGVLYTINANDNEATVVGYELADNQTTVSIPATISVDDNDYPVTEIKARAFEGCYNLETIDMSEATNLKSIGEYAFSECRNLASVTISNAVESIGKNAFAFCSDALTTINIPASVKTIGNDPFEQCYALTAITVDDESNYWSAQDGVLYDKDKTLLKCCPAGKTGSIVIPNTVVELAYTAFSNCRQIEAVTLPKNLKTIGSLTFWDCVSLSTITIPESVTSIGKGAFGNCHNTLTINCEACTILSTWDEMWNGWYGNYCEVNWAVGSYTYDEENHVLTVSKCVNFDDATIYPWYLLQYELESIVFENGVACVGDYAFSGFTNVTSVTLPSTIEYIGYNAFYDCDLTYTVSDNLNYLGYGDNDCMFLMGLADYGATSCTINGDCKVVASHAISSSSMVTVEVPDGVEHVGKDAFKNVKNVKYTGSLSTSDWGAMAYNGEDDGTFLYSDAEMTQIVAFIGTQTEVAIPSTVESIASSVFKNTNITSVDFSEATSLTSIGDYLFDGCASLHNVDMSGATNLTTVGNYLFGYTGSLDVKEVDLPNSVTNIGVRAFDRVKALFYSGSAQYGYNNRNWGALSLNGYVDENGFVLDMLNRGELLAYIGDGGDITIPSSVETIKPNAFIHTAITSVVIPESVTSIEEFAFSNCDALTSVSILSHMTNINNNAFIIMGDANDFCYETDDAYYLGNSDNNYLILYRPKSWNESSYEIESTCKAIATRAFQSCTNMEGITIPESVEKIGDYAFNNCYSLGEIIIPKTVNVVGEYVFNNCYNSNIKCEAPCLPSDWSLLWNSDGYPVTWAYGLPSDGDFVYADNTKTELVAYRGSASDVSIPSTVTTIGESAFSGCKTLASVLIPGTVTTIGNKAFYNCENLASVRIPSSVTSIGESAFENCSNMQIATIPQRVETIKENAFTGCCDAKIYCEAEERPDGWNANWRADCGYNNVFGETASDNYGTIDIVCSSKPDINTIEELPTAIEYIVQSANLVSDPWDQQFFISLTPQHALVEGEKYRFSFDVKADTEIGTYFAIQGQADNGDFIMWDVFGGYTSQTFTTSYNTYTYIGTVTAEQAGIYCFAIELNDYTWANTYYFRNIVFEELYLPERDVFEYEILDAEEQTAYIKKYNGKDGDVVIPSTVEIEGVKYTVTSIEENAFKNSTTIKSVSIPNTVTYIGSNAFTGCRNMTEIDIPNSVATIDNYAFNNCLKLGTVNIPSSVTEMGYAVFYPCTNTTINCEWASQPRQWNNGWNYEGGTVVWGNVPLPEFDFTVTDNATAALTGYYGEGSEVEIPATAVIGGKEYNVTSIGNDVFNGNNNIESVVFGENIASIGERSFANCSNLTSVIIPSTVTNIGEFAFNGCGFRVIFIPNTVETMGNAVFGNWVTGLKIFCQCAEEDKPDDWVEGWNNGYSVTWGASGIPEFEWEFNEEAQTAKLLGYYGSATEVVIPSTVSVDGDDYTVNQIGGGAFRNNNSIISVTIPATVTYMEGQVFDNCQNLTAVNVDDENEYYASEDGILYWTAYSSKTLIVYPAGKTGTEFDVPDDVTSIEYYAFHGNKYLETVTIPDNITYINVGVFQECSNLKSFVIPDGVVSIDGSAFSGCASLEEITIPASVEQMGWNVFEGDKNLTINCEVASRPTGWDINWNNDGGKVVWGNVELPEFVFTLTYDGQDAMLKSYNGSQSVVTVPATVEIDGVDYNVVRIDNYAFRNCQSLSEVILPNTITTIGSEAFQNCNNFERLFIPNTVEYIDCNAFSYCTGTLYFMCSEDEASSSQWYYSCWNNYFQGNVVWNARKVTLLVNAPAFGSVSGAGIYVVGDQVTVGATANNGCSFAEWDNDEGETVYEEATYLFVLQDNVTLTAIFNASSADYVLTVVANNSEYGTVSGGGYFSDGDVTTLTASPNNGYRFIGWYIGESLYENEVSFEYEVSGNNTITAYFEKIPANYTLEVGISNADAGSVSISLDGGENWTQIQPSEGNYNYSYEAGTVITLQANTNTGYEFWSWSDGEYKSAYTFTIYGDKSLIARFKANEYDVTVNYDSETGTVTGAGKYEYGQTAKLTAESASGYQFGAWFDGLQYITTNPYSFTVTENADFAAYFSLIQYYIYAYAANTHGTVDGGGYVNEGEEVTLTATAADGYHFTEWSRSTETETIIVSTDAEYTFNATEDITLIAGFAPDSHEITIAAGENGSVSGDESGTYDYDETLTVIAEPDNGYHFAGWSNGTEYVYDGEEYSFTVSGDTSLIAVFEPNSYSITIEQPENGAITGAESDSYDYSTVLNLVAEADEGYRFVCWTDDRENTESERDYTVTGNATISAVFAEEEVMFFNISATAEHGTVINTGAYVSGETVSLTAVADPNYEFVGWGDGIKNVTRIVVADRDVNLVALFVPVKFNITVIAEHGKVTGDGPQDFDSEITISVEPDYGYQFAGWSDGETEEPERTFTVEGDATFTALFEPIIYTVAFAECEGGTLTGDGEYAYGTEITLKAINGDGYKFFRWSDDFEAGAVRKFVVKGDTTLSAEFVPRSTIFYTISAEAEHGTVTGTGSFVAGDEITLTAVPDKGYKFTQWSDGETNASRSLTVTQTKTFVAEFEPATYIITVVAENGEIDGGDEYTFGDEVELTAIANDNYHFVRWSDGVTDQSRTIIVDGDATYTALFDPDLFIVTVIANHAIINGGGAAEYNSDMTIEVVAEAGYRFMGWEDDDEALASRIVKVVKDTTYTAVVEEISEYYVSVIAEHGRIEGVEESYAPGATAEVTAVADEHYHFLEWGDHVTTETRTVKVTNDMTLKAIFEIDKVNISGVHTNGTIEGLGLADYGSQVKLTAVPNEGFRFVKWSDGETSATRYYTATADKTFTAVFKSATLFTITVIAENGGTVKGGGESELNSQMNLEATPYDGYHFVTWSDGGKTPSHTITVTKDETYTATFEPNEYNIKVVAFHGVITGGGKAKYNTKVILEAIPEDGYKFVRWSDGVPTASRTVTVKGDETYTAEFEEVIYTVALEATAGGKVEGAGNNYKYNNEVTLQAIADKGYHFVVWSDNDSSAVRKVTITKDLKLTAKFEPNKYKITIVAENGTISGNGTGEYAYGSKITTTVSANKGYKFVRWSDGDNKAKRSIVVAGDSTFTAIITSSEVYTVAATAQNGTIEGANSYAQGETATLTATANTGYQFVRWSDGETAATRDVTVDGNKNLSAVFADANSTVYNVTGKANNGKVEGTSAYVAGETAKLTAVADNNYKFVRWSDGQTASTRNIKVDDDYNIDAVFAASGDEICKVTATAQNGTVQGASNYVAGETAKLEATADKGYKFIRWSDGETNESRNVVVSADVTLTAVFADTASAVYKVTVKTANGTVDGASLYLKGETATLTATANDNYKFIRWSDGDTTSTRTITVNGNWNKEAVFAKADTVVYKITATVENGTVEGLSKYIAGEEATLTAVADDGFFFVRWADGETSAERTVVVSADSAFIAIFSQKACIVSVEAENGVVTGVTRYALGETATLTATPDAGYVFAGWSNGVTDNPYSFEVTDNVELKALFEVNAFKVVVNAENGTVTGAGTFAKGATATLTATPADGYVFAGWSDGNTDNPRTLVVTADVTLTATFTDATDINDSEAVAVNIYAFGNTIVVENATSDIYVYNAMGALIDRVIPDAGRTEIQVEGVGIHVVKTGNVAKRVMIQQ